MLVAERRSELAGDGLERAAGVSLRERLVSEPQRMRADRDAAVQARARSRVRLGAWRSAFKPGWPLAAIFVLFPVWWVLGLTEWAPLLLTLPMAVYLLKLPRIEVPKGFGWWALYLVWSVAGVAVLNVPAVGAVADSSGTRIITYAYRLAWYAAVTIAGLYVLNTRDKVSTTWIVRVVSVLFVTVIAGGILGILAPTFEFSSFMELVLPAGVADVPFINHMIHPSAAQLQDVLGYESPRPSAPFSYTNTWGVHLAVLAPFFVLGWLGKGARWRRLLLPVVGVLALVAVIYSINRGLWLALAIAGVFLAVRAALLGRPSLLVAAVVAAVLALGTVAFTPLGTVVQDRLASQGSVEGRTNLSTLTVRSVALTSPFVGLGSTRNVQGNFNTIAGGATPDCPRCSPPALGTQGQIWLVVFSQGLVGLVLYLGFFVSVFLRHIRRRDPLAMMGLTVLVLSGVTMFVYNSLGTALMVVMIAVGLLARSQTDDVMQPAGGPAGRRSLAGIGARLRTRYAAPLPTLEGYGRLVRSNAAVITVLALLGAGAGVAWQAFNGTPVRAVTSVLVSENRVSSPLDTSGEISIDTEAQLLALPSVQAAVDAATSPLGPREERNLQILATPNSRVLHVVLTADHQADAVAGAQAAANAFIIERQKQYSAARQAQIDALKSRAAALDRDIVTQTSALRDVVGLDGLKVPSEQALTIKRTIEATSTELDNLRADIARLSAANLPAATVVAVPPPRARTTAWVVSAVSGLFIGLLVGLLIAAFRTRGGGVVGRERDPWLARGIPLLASVPTDRQRWWRRRREPRADLGGLVTSVLRTFGAERAVASSPGSRMQREVAAAAGSPLSPSRRGVVLLVDSTTPYRRLNRAAEDITLRGGEVRGAIHLGRPSRI